jgi:hypothetical protein
VAETRGEEFGQSQPVIDPPIVTVACPLIHRLLALRRVSGRSFYRVARLLG